MGFFGFMRKSQNRRKYFWGQKPWNDKEKFKKLFFDKNNLRKVYLTPWRVKKVSANLKKLSKLLKSFLNILYQYFLVIKLKNSLMCTFQFDSGHEEKRNYEKKLFQNHCHIWSLIFSVRVSVTGNRFLCVKRNIQQLF
jgi:hypothetical protein